jgi:hypothetical protein
VRDKNVAPSSTGPFSGMLRSSKITETDTYDVLKRLARRLLNS